MVFRPTWATVYTGKGERWHVNLCPLSHVKFGLDWQIMVSTSAPELESLINKSRFLTIFGRMYGIGIGTPQIPK